MIYKSQKCERAVCLGIKDDCKIIFTYVSSSAMVYKQVGLSMLYIDVKVFQICNNT